MKLEREVGHDGVLTITGRRIRSGRRVVIHPSFLDPVEIRAILAAILTHVLATDYANDQIAMTAGGASGAGG